MPVIAIVGGQWGDEGKGKVVDQLAENAQVVVRFSGGDNAGHTVINHLGEFKLHLVPAGIFSPEVMCVIGNGVVINPAMLKAELEMLQGKGVPADNLAVSDRAHLVMPYHILQDELEEASRAGKALGTTKRGIGPAFADRLPGWASAFATCWIRKDCANGWGWFWKPKIRCLRASMEPSR